MARNSSRARALPVTMTRSPNSLAIGTAICPKLPDPPVISSVCPACASKTLPCSQRGQRDGDRHIEGIPRRHLGHSRLIHCDIFGKGADTFQREPSIDGIARAEITDLAAYLHHDTRTLVAECLRQAVILNQPDTSRSDQQLQRIDGRRAYFDENLIRRRFRNGNLPNNQTAILRITIQLCSFHSSMRLILSFDACAFLRSCMTASILSTAHASSSSRIGRSVSLRAVSAYSTRGGTSA